MLNWPYNESPPPSIFTFIKVPLAGAEEADLHILLEENNRTPSRKRKRNVIHITFAMEASSVISDVNGLSTRKSKCRRMTKYNINLKPNKRK